jgi:hypothetical protein
MSPCVVVISKGQKMTATPMDKSNILYGTGNQLWGNCHCKMQTEGKSRGTLPAIYIIEYGTKKANKFKKVPAQTSEHA